MDSEEHGFVTSVTYKRGVVVCDVLAPRVQTTYNNVAMLKPVAGFSAVPQLGQKVTMTKLDDGKRFITSVLARGEANPADLAPGDVVLQLDDETKISFIQNGGSYDVELSASGTVTINGIDIENHTHEYDDETGSGTTTKDTKPPSQS